MTITITVHYSLILDACWLYADLLFTINFFQKFFQEYHQCQKLESRLGPISAQIVCKEYRQITKFVISRQTVKIPILN